MPVHNVNEPFANRDHVQQRLRANPLPLVEALQVNADVLRFGCPEMGSIAQMQAVAAGVAVLLEAALADRSAPDAIEAERNKAKIAQVLNLIGNVDHSKGNGVNSAKSRGDLLNTIRSIFQA